MTLFQSSGSSSSTKASTTGQPTPKSLLVGNGDIGIQGLEILRDILLRGVDEVGHPEYSSGAWIEIRLACACARLDEVLRRYQIVECDGRAGPRLGAHRDFLRDGLKIIVLASGLQPR